MWEGMHLASAAQGAANSLIPSSSPSLLSISTNAPFALLFPCGAGDKQQGFIGSKQWIGAIELGFVLDTLLGVSCKVCV